MIQEWIGSSFLRRSLTLCERVHKGGLLVRAIAFGEVILVAALIRHSGRAVGCAR